VVVLAGCARPARPVLEPGGTVTRTWTGTGLEPPLEKAPAEETPAEEPAPAAGAPAPPVAAATPPARPVEPTPEERPEPPNGRVWKKGGSWDR
jgi:hypothetical protein